MLMSLYAHIPVGWSHVARYHTYVWSRLKKIEKLEFTEVPYSSNLFYPTKGCIYYRRLTTFLNYVIYLLTHLELCGLPECKLHEANSLSIPSIENMVVIDLIHLDGLTPPVNTRPHGMSLKTWNSTSVSGFIACYTFDHSIALLIINLLISYS